MNLRPCEDCGRLFCACHCSEMNILMPDDVRAAVFAPPQTAPAEFPTPNFPLSTDSGQTNWADVVEEWKRSWS